MAVRISIQGFEGSFHQAAAQHFFGEVEVITCATFREVIKIAGNKKESDGGIMAIENSIAGSILPNYNLLQKSNLKIVGEIYLHIRQNLMVNPGIRLHDIHEVHSHHMALQQCLEYLDKYTWKLVETEDTALSAKHVHQTRSKHIAAVASKLAADLYNLEIIAPNIHTMKNNYTRFLVLQREGSFSAIQDANKASVNFNTDHSKGSLAKVLTKIAECGINLSKLQSFPIPGSDWKYSFHADMEFENADQFEKAIKKIQPITEEVKIYGLYKKEKLYSSIMKVSNRLHGIGEYYFSQKLKEIHELNHTGEPVINLGIGSPDLPPHPEVIKVLRDESAKANVHAYQSYKGSDVLRNAFSEWYKKWYGVILDPSTEILPLMGSKEGIMHICMTYLNKGDEVLIPNPGYPTYKSAVQLAGGKCVDYELKEENNWLIDINAIEQQDLTKIKLMWVNYPQMPTGQLPDKELFEKIVAFGKKYNILICHDNPYSFILNEQPMSIMAVEGAKENAIELNSLSKSHNMAGWRVGILCGARERIDEVLRFKSNMDSGMFLPVQLAAAKALTLDMDWFNEINSVYKARKIKAYELLNLLNCSYSNEQGGLFVWARIPDSYDNGFDVSDEVLYNAKVFITPGGIFGSAGEKFIRISLCSPEEKFESSINRIKKHLLKK